MKEKKYQEKVIKLIRLYRSHPILWDIKHKNYRRVDMKNKAFEEIAKEMGMTVDDLKKKMHSLRSTYTGERRKIKQKSGSGSEEGCVPTLSWFNEMRFLDNYIIPRKTLDNAVVNDTPNSHNWEEFEEVECETYMEEGGQSKLKAEFEEVECETYIEKRVPRKSKAETKLDKALEKLLEENENEFTAFGASIAQQLQKMPVEVGYQLMGDIQNLITQRKIKVVREGRYRPVTAFSETSSNSSNS